VRPRPDVANEASEYRAMKYMSTVNQLPYKADGIVTWGRDGSKYKSKRREDVLEQNPASSTHIYPG